MQLLLASASERRLTWLKENFNDFEIISKPLISEEKSINYGVDVKQQSLEICFSKAESAALEWGSQKLNDNKNPDIIIVSDTLVEDPDDSKIALGKPMDNLDATNMLLRLSGKRHKVWSSTAILVKNNKNYSKLATNWYYKIWTDFAIVEFCDLGDDDIFSLIENNSWVGKAGSYDLAGPAGQYTSIIEGSEETVLGFSNRAIVELRNLI